MSTLRDTKEISAVVRTWNTTDVQWGPMNLEDAIKMATESESAHRYVMVEGTIVFDYDDIIFEARQRGIKATLDSHPVFTALSDETRTVVARNAATKAATR